MMLGLSMNSWVARPRRTVLSAGLKTDSNYLPAYSNLAYLYLGQGHIEEAKQFFLERLKRAPDDDRGKTKSAGSFTGSTLH